MLIELSSKYSYGALNEQQHNTYALNTEPTGATAKATGFGFATTINAQEASVKSVSVASADIYLTKNLPAAVGGVAAGYASINQVVPLSDVIVSGSYNTTMLDNTVINDSRFSIPSVTSALSGQAVVVFPIFGSAYASTTTVAALDISQPLASVVSSKSSGYAALDLTKSIGAYASALPTSSGYVSSVIPLDTWYSNGSLNNQLFNTYLFESGDYGARSFVATRANVDNITYNYGVAYSSASATATPAKVCNLSGSAVSSSSVVSAGVIKAVYIASSAAASTTLSNTLVVYYYIQLQSDNAVYPHSVASANMSLSCLLSGGLSVSSYLLVNLGSHPVNVNLLGTLVSSMVASGYIADIVPLGGSSQSVSKIGGIINYKPIDGTCLSLVLGSGGLQQTKFNDVPVEQHDIYVEDNRLYCSPEVNSIYATADVLSVMHYRQAA